MAVSLFHVWSATGEDLREGTSSPPCIYPIDIYSNYDIWAYGTLIYGLVIIVVNLRILYSYQIYTYWGELLIFLSILSFFLTIIVVSFIKSNLIKNDLYGVILLYNDFGFFTKLVFVTFMFPIIDIIFGTVLNLITEGHGKVK